HYSQDGPVQDDRETEGSMQAVAGGCGGAGEVAVVEDVRNEGGTAGGPDAAGQSDIRTENRFAAELFEFGESRFRRMPCRNETQDVGWRVDQPQGAVVPP